MQVLYFIAAGLALYFVSDWILNRIEIARGGRLENRSIVFFAVLLGLALLTFSLVPRLLGD